MRYTGSEREPDSDFSPPPLDHAGEDAEHSIVARLRPSAPIAHAMLAADRRFLIA
jgi:hypothetical protein